MEKVLVFFLLLTATLSSVILGQTPRRTRRAGSRTTRKQITPKKTVELRDTVQTGSVVDDFEGYPLTEWAETSTNGNWIVNFNGFGSVGVETDDSLPSGSKQTLFQKPKASTSPNETHACLITSTREMGDFNLKLKMKTVQQLRAPTPNAWETAWVIWHYVDNTHFYYFTLKMNGWELGKEDPAYLGAQRFLKSGPAPKVNLGAFDEIRVQQTGATVKITVNGVMVTTFTDAERPYQNGKIGLYNEDAYVLFDDVNYSY